MCPEEGHKYKLKTIKPIWDPIRTFKISAKILNLIIFIFFLQHIFKTKDLFSAFYQLLFFLSPNIFQIIISKIVNKYKIQKQSSSFDISKEATISMLSFAHSFQKEKTESLVSILVLSSLGFVGTYISSFYIFFSFPPFSLPQIWWLILNLFLFIFIPIIRYCMEKKHQFIIYQWDECQPCNCTTESYNF